MKLNKKLTSILVTGAMIASVGGTTAMTSFAASVPAANPAADANLVKYLEMANGVTNPNEAFNFKFTQVKDDALGAAPIANQTITPKTATAADDEGAVYGAISFTDILKDTTFPKAGIYKYVVEEVEGINEEMTYDDSTYTITVTVVNGADGLEVKNIIAQEGGSVAEDGTATAATAGDKVDVTVEDPTEEPTGIVPGTTDDTDDGEEATNGTQIYGLTFDNNYQKTISEDPGKIDPNPEDPSAGNYGVLGVTKTVVGDFADKVAAYPFTITMQAPANYTGAATVDAYIYTGDVKGDKVEVALDDATDFALADGQALVFEKLPAGMKYTVNEKLGTAGVQNEDKYTASYAVIGDGAGTATGKQGEALATAAIQMTDKNKDVAAYTNTLNNDDVTPTGILMQNAPYILVATLAAGGLVIYLAKRREEEEEA